MTPVFPRLPTVTKGKGVFSDTATFQHNKGHLLFFIRNDTGAGWTVSLTYWNICTVHAVRCNLPPCLSGLDRLAPGVNGPHKRLSTKQMLPSTGLGCQRGSSSYRCDWLMWVKPVCFWTRQCDCESSLVIENQYLMRFCGTFTIDIVPELRWID